jgi:SAM-dependent methyltransferase
MSDIKKLPPTGERYLPEFFGNIALEHIHRYRLAREICEGKDVLDIACGEGYGSEILSAIAKTVVGVDNASEAIDYAAAKYSADNLTFMLGSCDQIPLPDHSVDVVASFETIEHHDQHDAMLAEIKRVLRTDGILIISSPDKHEYTDIPSYHNPFHVKELYAQEFKDFVSSAFANTLFFGQRVVYGSSIMPEQGSVNLRNYSWDGGQTTSGVGLVRPMYIIGVASDAPLPIMACGVFEQPLEETDLANYKIKYEAAVADAKILELRLDALISELRLELERVGLDLLETKSKTALLTIEATNFQDQINMAKEREVCIGEIMGGLRFRLTEREQQLVSVERRAAIDAKTNIDLLSAAERHAKEVEVELQQTRAELERASTDALKLADTLATMHKHPIKSTIQPVISWIKSYFLRGTS